jgi:5'-3' exonuclease
MCILCGTDYSSSIPGIGPMKAYKYIKMYGSIENIGKMLKIDISALNHIRLREIFARADSGISTIIFPKRDIENKRLLKNETEQTSH